MSFQEELTALINRYSLEINSDTPDYLLAEYLIDCLDVFNRAVHKRDLWYNRQRVARDRQEFLDMHDEEYTFRELPPVELREG